MSNKTVAIIDFGAAAINAAIFYEHSWFLSFFAFIALLAAGLIHSFLAFMEMKS